MEKKRKCINYFFHIQLTQRLNSSTFSRRMKEKRITETVTNDRSRIKTDEDLCDRNTFIWQKGDRRKTTLTHFVPKVNREKQ